jgi:fatty-acyl-CoA synthase
MPVGYYDCIAYHALRRPHAVAAIDLATERRHTYRTFDDRISRLATAMRDEYGVGRGDRVAVFAPNTTDTFEVQFACARLGAILVPLNWRLAQPELQAILGDCAPVLLVYDLDFAERAEELVQACDVPHRCMRGPFDSPYEHAATQPHRLEQPELVTLDDVSTILYTSGTTGLPKGAIITHGMNVWNTVNSTGPALLSPSSVFLGLLPLFHTGGLNVFANPLFYTGGTVMIARSFDPGEALHLIGDPSQRISHLFGVPASYQFMAQHPSFRATDLTRLVFAGIGGAPTPDATLETWKEQGAILQQGYGMTETGPLVLLQERDDAVHKPGSAGTPVLHTEVRVVRADGSDAATGEIGELWVKGPNITPGYWNQPEVTRAAFTDYWLHTGDAAILDEDGCYTIVDRWKDMYISGGENVYPAEVENVLYQVDGIAEAAVIGMPDARWGEVGCAIVVVKPGHTLTETALLTHCAGNLARYKLPHSVVFTDVLPRNATGKVHKPTLREKFGRRGVG